MQAKIHRTINLLEKLVYLLPAPHSKKVTGIKNLYELRVKLGSDICRLFYFHWKDRVFVITSGYMKKANKTDVKEIAQAVRLMNQVKGE